MLDRRRKTLAVAISYEGEANSLVDSALTSVTLPFSRACHKVRAEGLRRLFLAPTRTRGNCVTAKRDQSPTNLGDTVRQHKAEDCSECKFRTR